MADANKDAYQYGFDVGKWQKDRVKKQLKGAQALEGFREFMYKKGFTYIVVHYEGCGDSGEAYDMEGYKTEKCFNSGDHFGGEYIQFTDYGTNTSESKPIPAKEAYKKGTRGQYDVWKAIKQFNKLTGSDIDQYSIVDLIDYDWYNNDGGQGFVVFNLKDGEIFVDGSQNYSESRDVTQKLYTDGRKTVYES